MPANTSPIFVEAPNLAEVTIVNGTGTGLVDLIVAGADGTKVRAISVCSDDAARNLALWIHDGTTAFLVGTVPIAASAGFNGSTPAVDVLDPVYLPWLDADGEFWLPSGYKLQVGVTVAVTAAKSIYVVGHAGNY